MASDDQKCEEVSDFEEETEDEEDEQAEVVQHPSIPPLRLDFQRHSTNQSPASISAQPLKQSRADSALSRLRSLLASEAPLNFNARMQVADMDSELQHAEFANMVARSPSSASCAARPGSVSSSHHDLTPPLHLHPSSPRLNSGNACSSARSPCTPRTPSVSRLSFTSGSPFNYHVTGLAAGSMHSPRSPRARLLGGGHESARNRG